MRHLFSIFIALCACLCAHAQDSLLTAFPGAEGYGKFTSGGRGGDVYHVTRLDDCTDANLVEGTLRWALRTGDNTPRTIVFDTCGTLVLTTKLKLEHPNVTIAGQTAPGGGICIAGACIYVCKPNVIIRHIRFRPGDIMQNKYQSLDVENTKNVIIDHCSMTWAVEECLTMYDCDSTTVQWTIIGEGLYNAGHSKGTRAYATQWGGEHGTMHHCLISNCNNRTPRFNGVRSEANIAKGHHDHDAQVDNEFVNNVIFNWCKKNSLYGGENDTTKNKVDGKCIGYNHTYMMGNYFRAGPATKAANMSQRYFVQGSKAGDWGRWYLSGNMFETGNKHNATSRSAWTDDELKKVNEDNLFGYTTNYANRAFNLDGLSANNRAYAFYVLEKRYASSDLAVEDATDAYDAVCATAGASLPRYDEVDLRMLAEAAGSQDPQYVGKTATTWIGIIDSQNDITFAEVDSIQGLNKKFAYPSLGMRTGDTTAVDTDRDGMPDSWETAHGLNPNDAADRNLTTLSALPGYTNLEFFLNGGEGEMAAVIAAAEVVPDPVWSAVSYLEAEKTQPTYIFENGQVLIDKKGQKYTLSGQKMQ